MTGISHKRCPRCGETKPHDDFYNSSFNKDGKATYCRSCDNARRQAWDKANPDKVRRQKLRSRFGITVEQFDEMLESQGGCCAICGTTEPGGRDNTFHVDHCHDSGEIRALLCHKCNVGLGHFNDNPELLQAAIEYLEVHNECKLDAA